MEALRQEALHIVNNVPEKFLVLLVQYLKNFKPNEIDSVEVAENKTGIDPKKAAALQAVKEWQDRNRAILESGIDWDKEIELALEEKYGPFI